MLGAHLIAHPCSYFIGDKIFKRSDFCGWFRFLLATSNVFHLPLQNKSSRFLSWQNRHGPGDPNLPSLANLCETLWTPMIIACCRCLEILIHDLQLYNGEKRKAMSFITLTLKCARKYVSSWKVRMAKIHLNVDPNYTRAELHFKYCWYIDSEKFSVSRVAISQERCWVGDVHFDIHKEMDGWIGWTGKLVVLSPIKTLPNVQRFVPNNFQCQFPFYRNNIKYIIKSNILYAMYLSSIQYEVEICL